MQPMKINSLQLLRAVAVSLVVLIHTSNFVGVSNDHQRSPVASFYDLIHWGSIGVDLFFVISGFIMILIFPAYTGHGKWKDFLVKRALRIVPVYYLVSLYLYVSESLYHTYISNVAILKTLFFFPVFDTETFAVPVLFVGWSLSYEMYFYVLIAIFLILKGRIARNLLIAIIVLSRIGVVLNPAPVLFKFLTSPMLLEFGLGIIAGIIYKHAKFSLFYSIPFSMVLLLAGGLLMALSIFTGSKDVNMQEVIENDNNKALFRVVIWGIPCAVLTLGTLLLERSANFQTPALLILLGDASYSAYLIHIKVYQWYSKVFAFTKLGDMVFILSAIVVCFVSSIIFYNLVERPLSAVVHRLYLSSKKVNKELAA